MRPFYPDMLLQLALQKSPVSYQILSNQDLPSIQWQYSEYDVFLCYLEQPSINTIYNHTCMNLSGKTIYLYKNAAKQSRQHAGKKYREYAQLNEYTKFPFYGIKSNLKHLR